MRNKTTEQGNILLYAVISVTFLASLAFYLRTISSPILPQSTDTISILEANYINESINNILSSLTHEEVSALDTESAVSETESILKSYATVEIDLGNVPIKGKIKLAGSPTTKCYNNTPIITSTISNLIDINTSITVKKQFNYSKKINGSCLNNS